MWRSASLACASCQNQSQCSDCSAFYQSSIAFKAYKSRRTIKSYPNAYKKVSNFAYSEGVKSSPICNDCESKLCFTCSMYNTHFIKEA